MATALINEKILTWARVRAGFSISELVEKINKKYELWEKGEAKPTFNQAQEVAKKLHIPFGYLYLNQPPYIQKMTADLRTFKDHEKHEYSLELQDVMSDAIRKQDWYKEFLVQRGAEHLEFVGKFSIKSPIQDVADDIIRTLNLDVESRKTINKDYFLSRMTERAEDAGIIVIRNSKVGLNTHRPLDVEEFRGFVLTDPIVPLVFVNANDFVAGQIFTLFHELAHIWIGEAGVSNAGMLNKSEYSKTEQFCNSVAAEVLVPHREFAECWRQTDGDFENHVEELTKIFKVSSVVIARRALDYKFVRREEFFNYYRKLQEIWRKTKKKQKEKEGGPSFRNTFPIYNSKTFTDTVCRAVYSGELLMRDGMSLLGVAKSKAIENYATESGLI
ncbi:hypothetical protein SMSP2_01532 [Limihaloglobus sulfuriphilus]|uniref:HTH cro/C1-type domain-containing protein n=1 Tax=Limihaloglobus sulfuriphilus TaxID=1851148 RepID=A0A1Q2MEN4_9BACT|nr:ImmA/IrrE family metallo-endopeptidase [Limihaloglobus sulfuriphilus]AQQ71166.1 hypothetical protein SMSP2_01532 [Limihaloglobus sulfuriphilus]